ncbi:MAG: CrcB family protein [Thermoleophilia bacterium]
MATRILLIAVAGSLGALSRYSLGGLAQRLLGAQFPWGTMVVNVFGCFLAGILFELFQARWPLSTEARVIVFVGFLGAFTTFSSVMVETANFGRDGQWLSLAANLILQNGLGVAAVFAGLAAARAI